MLGCAGGVQAVHWLVSGFDCEGGMLFVSGAAQVVYVRSVLRVL